VINGYIFFILLLTSTRKIDIILFLFIFQAKPLLGSKKYSELVDPIISKAYEEDQLHWLVQVVSKCLKKKPKERLSMNMVSTIYCNIYIIQKVQTAERRDRIVSNTYLCICEISGCFGITRHS
jgi:hypothetical protein